MRRMVGLAVALGAVSACGGGAPDEGEPEPTEVVSSGGEGEGDGPAAEAEPAPPEPGSSFATPLPTCGAAESYAAVARFTCKDGSTPLGGDPVKGAQARRGSLGSHSETPPRDLLDTHIVDLYEVPCAAGAVEVYVCMYHCPPGRTPMD